MFKLLSVAGLLVALAGCASLNTVNSEVSTYGPWPAGRQPASFVFERLPSQAARPERQQQLEDAARGAVEAAGFRAAADPKEADYLMQVGARVTNNDPWVYNDALFWRGGWRAGYGHGYGRWGHGPFWGLNGGLGYAAYPGSFEREVALLIRDRKTGQLLYEARANNTGSSDMIDPLLPALFEAAMKDFPGTGPNPRQVTTHITR